MAKDTAALLTAAAHGPLSAWCFVAPSDFGLGLWAREALYPHQALGEYAGPRLPLSMHQRGEYVLGIASRQKGPAWQGQRSGGLLFLVAWRAGAGAHKHLSLAASCGQASPAPTWSSTARARTARARVRRAAARCHRAILSTRRVRRAVWLCRPRSVATASFLAAPWMQMYQHHPTQASPFALRSRRPVRLPSLLRRLRQPLLSSQRAARAVAGAAPRCMRGAAAHGARRKRAGVS